MATVEFVGKWQAGAQAHAALYVAVAAAWGWVDYTAGMPDEEILRRLLALNRERAWAG
jgi:hypothetical protein